MAGDWIPMRLDLHTDPAVMRMADELETCEELIVGYLHSVWSWASLHSEDGRIEASPRQIARIASQDFVDAMQLVGWLEVHDGFIVFPKFETWMASSAKKRLQAAKRKQRERCHADVTQGRDKNVTTVQNSTEQNIKSSVLSDSQGGNAFEGHSASSQADSVFGKLRESDFSCMETMRRWFDWQVSHASPAYPKATKEDWRTVQAIARQVQAEAKRTKVGMFAKMTGGGIAPKEKYYTEAK